MTFRPLLAPQDDPLNNPSFFTNMTFPKFCSPKYDGIRGLPKNGVVLSRTGKPLRSLQVQAEFTEGTEHFDGELIEGNPCDFGVYNRTQSHVSSRDKPGDLSYFVFDYTHPDYLQKPYYERLEYLESLKIVPPKVYIVEQKLVESLDEMFEYEESQLAKGYEGIMMRSPIARYKNGRATYLEDIIYKLKRFTDAEGLLIGVVEAMTNNNPLETNELGYAKRSSHKAFKHSAGRVGSFIVSFEGLEVTVSPGAFTHSELNYIWEHQDEFVNKVYVKFRYMSHGVKVMPRFPRALGFRDLSDM